MKVAIGILDMFCLSACFLALTSANQHLAGARFGKPRRGSTLSSDVPAQSAFIDGTIANGSWSFANGSWSFQERPVSVVDDLQHRFFDIIDTGGIKAHADARFTERDLGQIIFGIILFVIAFPIQWYNEERNARIKIFLRRGCAECVSISSEKASQENHGRLVHVQGWAHAAIPLKDIQFQNAQVTNCLKLKSTLEVLEWVQMPRTSLDGQTLPVGVDTLFQTEWTTYHQDLQQIKKPSPENPRLPDGISLGSFTQVCPRIKLGAFALPNEMVDSFLKFEPAMKHLPQTLHMHGFTFFANPEDGYYYMRPGVSSLETLTPNLLSEHNIGNIRALFMCVPDCEATIVAVQCRTDLEGGGTFVPYRPFKRGPSIADCQVRGMNIEKEGKLLTVPTGKSEKVTEEMFYATDQLVPRSYPFDKMVPPNPCRVWLFRLIGWGLMYLGIAMVLGPFAGVLEHVPCLTAYGNAAPFMLSAIVTLATAGCIMALVYAFYEPIMILKCFFFVTLIIIAPLLWGVLSPSAKTARHKA